MKIIPKKISAEQLSAADQKMRETTRKVALIIAFASVFIYFFKLLFF